MPDYSYPGWVVGVDDLGVLPRFFDLGTVKPSSGGPSPIRTDNSLSTLYISVD